MRSPSKNTETPLPVLLDRAGLKLPKVINNLNHNLTANKETFAVVRGIMDSRTELTEKIKILELELFIAILKKF
jgi:hypothetical protein